MKIAKIETLRLGGLPRLLMVRVTTACGLVGVGETYDKVEASESALHSSLAPLLLGNDPRRINALHALMVDNVSYHGLQGAEMRALSAVDVALWDLTARSYGTDVAGLLGGPVDDRLPSYNTCIGHGAINDYPRWYDDAGGLATDLWEAGVRAMKVWPFDRYAEATRGQRITDAEIEAGVSVVRQIKEATDGRMGVGVEGHSRWTLPCALRIAKALEPYGPLFFEDPIGAFHPGRLAELSRATSVPVVGSETLLSRYAVRDWLMQDASPLLMTDPIWNGGITETVRIAALASSFGRPMVLHNLGGPIAHAAISQVGSTLEGLMYLETTRAATRGYFDELTDAQVEVEDGAVKLIRGEGLGLTLREEVWSRDDAVVRTSEGTGQAEGLRSMGDHWSRPALR